MPNIKLIDETGLTEVGPDGTQEQSPPAWKDSAVNSKLLYAATLAVSLLATLVMAAEAPASESGAAEIAAAIAASAPSPSSL